jgi:hypothetical protein
MRAAGVPESSFAQIIAAEGNMIHLNKDAVER